MCVCTLLLLLTSCSDTFGGEDGHDIITFLIYCAGIYNGSAWWYGGAAVGGGLLCPRAIIACQHAVISSTAVYDRATCHSKNI